MGLCPLSQIKHQSTSGPLAKKAINGGFLSVPVHLGLTFLELSEWYQKALGRVWPPPSRLWLCPGSNGPPAPAHPVLISGLGFFQGKGQAGGHTAQRRGGGFSQGPTHRAPPRPGPCPAPLCRQGHSGNLCSVPLTQATYVTVQSPLVIFKLAHRNVCRPFCVKNSQEQVGLLFLVDPWGESTAGRPRVPGAHGAHDSGMRSTGHGTWFRGDRTIEKKVIVILICFY